MPSISGRRTQIILTQNNVSLTISGGATPTNQSAFISCDGWDTINVVTKASAVHNGRFQICWSFDGTSVFSYELPSGVSGSTQYRQATVPVKAPYFMLLYENQDVSVAPTGVFVNCMLKA